ncbi:YkvA family protein [Siminovitchia sediminis]|uniref:YkvA family protein n=1 Tax=Siminovitchia sediminis TaxID=1274353 RepID=A0ABW4KLY6_9BACI
MFKYLKRMKFMLKFWKFLPFLIQFFTSKDVQLYKKALGVLLILAYAFFPFDMIPDYLAFLGIIDDVVIAGFVLERMIKMAPPSLKEKYNLIENV